MSTQRLRDKPATQTVAAQQQEWPEIMSPTQRLSQVGLPAHPAHSDSHVLQVPRLF
jgi:hypothetical protein